MLLEDAVDAFTRSGAPFEAAQARLALAASLAALGRAEAAERESAAARERLRELGAPAALPLPELTPREREVLALLAEGLTNRGIAERLVVSEHTVHRHVTSILRKLDLPSRTAAAAVAVRSGLIARTGYPRAARRWPVRAKTRPPAGRTRRPHGIDDDHLGAR